jgi:Holliday junction resolvase RusA-like endonuclease
MTTTIYISGDPAAQGSKRMVRLKNGRTVLLEQSKRVKPWREQVAAAARAARCPMRDGDIAMYARVRLARPASHLRKDGSVKPSAPARPGRMDVDKIARSICDALTGIAWQDDRQVACLAIERVWCEEREVPGAVVSIAAAPAEGRWAYEHL